MHVDCILTYPICFINEVVGLKLDAYWNLLCNIIAAESIIKTDCIHAILDDLLNQKEELEKRYSLHL